VMTARGAFAPRAPLIAAAAIAALAMLAATIGLARIPAVEPAQLPSAGSVTANAIKDLERRAFLDGGRLELSVLLATPAYFRATAQQALGDRYGAERDIVVLLGEDVHFGDLPAPLRPVLLLDGRAHLAARVEVLMEAAHHRATAVVYSDPDRALVHPGIEVAELEIAGATGALRWDRPYGGAASDVPALSIPLVFALFGGILASMWPCLFQLTAYFIPSVAGLSLDEARAGTGRADVLRTAILFVSGIVVVYTLAGLLAGLAAQSLSGTALFESWRRPLTAIAGVVILAMAARLALRARQPLACAMPVSAPRRSSGIGTIALGLAFATGCMTCFGAALVLGMFTYVVTTASPLVGAAILFLFSLGIAVPLVVAAMAMARVLPLLTRLERGAPVLTLASAGIMAVYGVLLVSGTSHVVSDTVARVAGVLR
jgi:cytochrome c-type biogenesis protein